MSSVTAPSIAKLPAGGHAASGTRARAPPAHTPPRPYYHPAGTRQHQGWAQIWHSPTNTRLLWTPGLAPAAASSQSHRRGARLPGRHNSCPGEGEGVWQRQAAQPQGRGCAFQGTSRARLGVLVWGGVSKGGFGEGGC